MTMANIPLLVLLVAGGVGLLHLVVAGVFAVVGRRLDEPVPRRIGRSLALGSLGTVLLYAVLVALWIGTYESNREVGTTLGLIAMFSTPFSLALPSFLGTVHYVYRHTVEPGR